MKKITFPPTDEERQTRNVVMRIIQDTGKPVFLECQVVSTRVEEGVTSTLPVVDLELIIQPPKLGTPLAPFSHHIHKRIKPPELPAEPFHPEEALGKVTIPWGKTLTEKEANEVFNPWLDKYALAELNLATNSYSFTKTLRVVALHKLEEKERKHDTT